MCVEEMQLWMNASSALAIASLLVNATATEMWRMYSEFVVAIVLQT